MADRFTNDDRAAAHRRAELAQFLAATIRLACDASRRDEPINLTTDLMVIGGAVEILEGELLDLVAALER